jgi:hypothetical protein
MAGPGLSATYVDADTFTVAGNLTTTFVVGRRIKADCGVDGYKFGTISASSFGGGVTTVDLTAASDDLTANLDVVWYGVVGGGATDQSIPIHTHDGSEGSGGSVTDADAIHDNASGEINAIASKATPVDADIVIIEDSAASYAKKKATLNTTSPNAIHDDTSGEINAITSKATPVAADVIIIEDSAASFAKKKATLTSLINGVFGSSYQYNSSDTQSNTTSATPQQKLNLTTGSLTSGTYRIDWSFEFHVTVGKNNGEFNAQVQINNTTTIAALGDSLDWGVEDVWIAQSGFYNGSLSGVQSIDIDYWDTEGTGVSIRRARLMIFRVA